MLYNRVYSNEFKRISTSESAQEAWDISKSTHEGTNVVKVSKFQKLTTDSDNLVMSNDDSLMIFMLSSLLLLIFI